MTGLIWEVKTNDNGLRDKDWHYTWYSTDSNTNGNNAGSTGSDSCGGTLSGYGNYCNTSQYVVAINAIGLCGANDWRMPSSDELNSLIHYGVYNPSIDTTYFPNTLSEWYWTATNYAAGPADAWVVYFGNGNVDYVNKASAYAVRVVRASQ